MVKADVLLILEGTYPYVRGGVSSWVHQLILGLPELKFELLFLGGHPSHYGPIQYTLPDNVTGLSVHYMMDDEDSLLGPTSRPGNSERFELWRQVQDHFRDSRQPIPAEQLKALFESLGKSDGLPEEDFLYSQASWQVLADYYLQYCDEPSFVDFFWAYRNIYRPLFKIARIARELPKVRLLHAISTGYAGFLGAGASQLTQTPFALTEHGIYTKERKIDLIQAGWIKESEDRLGPNLNTEMGYIRRMWIHFFEQLGRTAYQHASPIVALYDGNRQRQIRDGAPPEQTQVIPNGIRLGRFAKALAARGPEIPKVAGLIGRVVPIKDIKTFIRAIKEALPALPELEGWIVGPTEEDPNYLHECQLLVDSLDLAGKVKFLGMQDVSAILPQLGVVALTSISEAQPLVLLEAMAAGVPVLATDVGSCREIIEGLGEEDHALGKAGTVVSIASPGAAARAMVDILTDSDSWQAYQQAGLKRVERYYDERLMFERYQQLYKEAMSWPE